ncbi:MAG: transpeptidase family protein [Melioribacteraceae bacterium]|nr:transpeptidase family protein [Melioribacteraceae bacterium]MCF8266089.1 transpeptidase family protein [Melioribacteraceae bacterium]
MIDARVKLISFFIVTGFLVIIYNLVQVQIVDHEKYKFFAERQQNKSFIVKAERGLISDRNGEVLAYTKDDISYYVDSRMAKDSDIEKIASKFSAVFNKPKEFYVELIQSNSKNVCIEKKVPKAKALELNGFVANGFFSNQDFSRVYPYGSLASHLVGYVDYTNRGINGIEKHYDDKLQGSDGSKWVERDVLGRVISVNKDQTVPPRNGNNVYLTINKTYQKILEEGISQGLQEFGSDSAVGIIQNPNTGEILAMASFPAYDPNNYNLFSNSSRRNRAITDTYEPGSTMKAVSFSIMIEEGLIDEKKIIDTENGEFTYHDVKIADTHPERRMTVRQVLEYSSNIGMVKLTQKLDDNVLYKYLRDFGFNNPTSIDLPGEAKGYLKKPSLFTGISKPYISIGYEVSVTPLQMITAFSSLINGGILYEPFILKEMVDESGRKIKENNPTVIRRIIGPETSEQMKDLLVGVVENGTGNLAKLDNVLVGGKTGTSQKLIDGKYSKEKYNSSFIGFLPAENPKVVCLVYIDSPKRGKYGGKVAAPIFQKIARRLVEADRNLVPDESRINRTKHYIDEFIADFNDDEKMSSVANPGEIQKPVKKEVPIQKLNVMPDLTNLTTREAIAKLGELELKHKIIGSGKIASQSIKVGDKIEPGMLCVLRAKKKELKSLKIN